MLFQLTALALAVTSALAVAVPSVPEVRLQRRVPADSPPLNIHPATASTVDRSKCIGIVGGVLTNGTLVDIYDCNGSATQKWVWVDHALTLTHPTTGVKYCLDAGNINQLQNGTKLKIWQCFLPSFTLPQQTWRRPEIDATVTGDIRLWDVEKCIDLTDGIKTNKNPLQAWDCVGGMFNPNQVWQIRLA